MNTQQRIRVALAASCAALWTGCAKAPVQPGGQPSAVSIVVNATGPVTIKTSAAEFDLQPSGYLQAYLIKSGNRLSLDEPGQGPAAARDYLVSAGQEIRDFQLDFSSAKITLASNAPPRIFLRQASGTHRPRRRSYRDRNRKDPGGGSL